MAHVIAVLQQHRATQPQALYSSLCSKNEEISTLWSSARVSGQFRWRLPPSLAISHPFGHCRVSARWMDPTASKPFDDAGVTGGDAPENLKPALPPSQTPPPSPGNIDVRSPTCRRSRLIDRAPSPCAIARDPFQAPTEHCGRRASPSKIM